MASSRLTSPYKTEKLRALGITKPTRWRAYSTVIRIISNVHVLSLYSPYGTTFAWVDHSTKRYVGFPVSITNKIRRGLQVNDDA